MSGTRVLDAHGMDIGKIEDIAIDVMAGRVAYAVLSFGGILGMGDKLFAIPWKKLRRHAQEWRLDVERRRLEQAPGFNKDNWPDLADPSWEMQISGYYGSDVNLNQDDAATGVYGAARGTGS
jgi:hypothetical protein